MYSAHKTLASLGYLAPEYPYMGHQTHESDVFAFGALLLELLTGRRPMFLLKESRTLIHTATWIRPLLEVGRVTDFVDPKLEMEYSLAGAAGLAHIALQCMSEEPCERPSMGNVVQRMHASDSWVDTAMDSFLLSTPRRKSCSSPSPRCSRWSSSSPTGGSFFSFLHGMATLLYYAISGPVYARIQSPSYSDSLTFRGRTTSSFLRLPFTVPVPVMNEFNIYRLHKAVTEWAHDLSAIRKVRIPGLVTHDPLLELLSMRCSRWNRKSGINKYRHTCL